MQRSAPQSLSGQIHASRVQAPDEIAFLERLEALSCRCGRIRIRTGVVRVVECIHAQRRRSTRRSSDNVLYLPAIPLSRRG